MKKILAFTMALFMAISLAACKKAEQNNPVTPDTPDAGQQAAQENEEVLEQFATDTEEVEIPALSADDIESYVKDNGGKDVTVNKDGSVDVDMTDEEYNAMMEKIGKTILDKLELIRKADPMVESVQTGLNFDKYYIFVDKAAYDANPSVIDISDCCESAEMYQLLSGKKTEDINITLYIMNKDDDLEIARKVYTVKQ